MGIKQKDENSAGGLHNALAAGTTIRVILSQRQTFAWMEK